MNKEKDLLWKKDRIAKINKYLETEKRQDFIDDDYINSMINKKSVVDKVKIAEIIAKSKTIKGLAPEEAAYLINIEDKNVWEDLYEAARYVKNEVYGNRIVLFAPMYLSNECVNDCVYCGFRESNEAINHKVLSYEEIKEEVKAFTSVGHKRVLAVYGEGPESDAKYIAGSMKAIYAAKFGKDEIRRVNVNAAPQFVDEYKLIKQAQIGTYQIFQETYNKERFKQLHGKDHIKSIYKWRLFALHRAQEAGISDVAIGALFGIYDWKFEVLAMMYHAADMDREFGVGTHTISFPRLEPAINTPFYNNNKYKVTDDDMRKIVTVLRLAVPYTGLILTARETPEFRRELIQLGVSQTDAGTNIAIGGYKHGQEKVNKVMEKQQFEIADKRSLDDYISELIDFGYIPSFCTADYRCGRVGCDFMELAKAGKMKKLCIPNAVLTFAEYLIDYASPNVKEKGEKLLTTYLNFVRENATPTMARLVEEYLERIRKGERDLYF
ncbi:MAG: [FeFe] hydrogenase H-cluster radical SAM maturase HydG [bacterium]